MTVLPCSYRYEGLRGDLITLLVCGNKDHEKQEQMVTPEDCSQCPLRKGAGQLEVKKIALQGQRTHGGRQHGLPKTRLGASTGSQRLQAEVGQPTASPRAGRASPGNTPHLA